MMRELNKIQNWIFRIGALLFVSGLGIHLFNHLCGVILFVVGVLGFTTMQMLMRYDGYDITMLRLRRQQLISDVAFLLAAACMIMQDFRFGPIVARQNSWIICMIVGCVLQLYTSFRIPQVLERLNRNGLKSLFLTAGLGAMALQSCSTQQYNVTGTTNVSMLEGRTLYLKVFSNESMLSLDSCQVQHGKIQFSGFLDSTEMVNIFMEEESMMPMVLEEGFINLTIDDGRQNVTGSPMNDTLYSFINAKMKLERELDELSKRDTKMIMDGVDEEERAAFIMSECERLNRENDRLVTSFIINNSDNVLGPGVFMIMTSAFPFPQMNPQIEEILFRAKPYFKSHPYVKQYINAAEQNMRKIHNGGM